MAVRKLNESWWVDFMYNGQRTRKRSPFNTRSGAETFEATLRQLVAQHGSVDRAISVLDAKPEKRPMFGMFCERWLRDYVDVNNGRSERYNKRKSIQGKLVPFFGRMRLDEITANAIERFKADLLAKGLNAKTINNHLTILRRCLGSACEWEVISAVPRIKLLKTAPPPFRFLTPEQTETLLDSIEDTMVRAMVRTAVRAGLRYSELRALHWEDVNFDRKQLTVRRAFILQELGPTKNHKVRYIPIAPDLVAELQALPRTSEFVFRVRSSNWRQLELLKRECALAGVPVVGWHNLRHTFASHLMAAGIPVHMVKDLLGHSSIEMTMRYTHLAPTNLRDAISVLSRPKEVVATRCQPKPLWEQDHLVRATDALPFLRSTTQKDATSR